MNVLEALMPVIALILVGYCSRKYGFLSTGFWEGAESLTYFILFPALILYRLTGADFSIIEVTPLLTVIIAFYAILIVLVWGLNRGFLSLEHPQWTSMLQGSVRFNTFIALALTDILFGPQMFAVSALVVGMFIIIVNLVVVIAFTTRARPSPVTLCANLVSNPLIAACLVGIGLNQFNFLVPGFVIDTLSAFGRGALPLALLAVGAGLKLKALTTVTAPLLISSMIKLGIAPLLMAALAFVIIKEPVTRQLLIVFACVPTASSAYILSRKLGGDAEFMATIITFQTLVSVFTVTAVLFLIL